MFGPFKRQPKTGQDFYDEAMARPVQTLTSILIRFSGFSPEEFSAELEKRNEEFEAMDPIARRGVVRQLALDIVLLNSRYAAEMGSREQAK